MSKSIKISITFRGEVKIVKLSLEDIDIFKNYKIGIRVQSSKFKAFIFDENGKYRSLGKMIAERKYGGDARHQLRHINGDTLDYRRDNLTKHNIYSVLSKNKKFTTVSLINRDNTKIELIFDNEDTYVLDKYIFSLKSENLWYRGNDHHDPLTAVAIEHNMVNDVDKYVLAKNGNRSDCRKENILVSSSAINRSVPNKVKKTNKVGMTGVRPLSGARGGVYLASILGNDGKIKKKTFQISKYGEAEAFRLACEWRIQKEKEYGYAHSKEEEDEK